MSFDFFLQCFYYYYYYFHELPTLTRGHLLHYGFIVIIIINSGVVFPHHTPFPNLARPSHLHQQQITTHPVTSLPYFLLPRCVGSLPSLPRPKKTSTGFLRRCTFIFGSSRLTFPSIYLSLPTYLKELGVAARVATLPHNELSRSREVESCKRFEKVGLKQSHTADFPRLLPRF